MITSELEDVVTRVWQYKDILDNEAQTRSALIEPFLIALGYDIHDPFEVIPEHNCDVGTKKGEKVDYALALNNSIEVLIEVKSSKTVITQKHVNQLYRYFTTSRTKIAILTNGVFYAFFTDSERENIMDLNPFYVLSMCSLTAEDKIFLASISKENLTSFNAFKVQERIEQFKRTQHERDTAVPEDEESHLLFED